MKKIISLLVVIFLLSINLSTVWAGKLYEGWTEPQMLSDDVSSYHPDIVADNYGQLHAVWTEKHGDSCSFDTVMYAVNSQEQWSQPLDILTSPNSPFCVTNTSIAYSKKDARLYVTWTNYVMYVASAPVNEALNAKNWSEPIMVDNISDYDPAIAIDYTGRVHLVFFREKPYWELYYTHSDDQGYTWTNPTLLHETSDNFTDDRVHIDVDARGRVHVVWTEYILDDLTDRGGAVYYKRSIDGGDTWDDTIIIDQKNENYQSNYGPGEINVITADKDFVLLAWAGMPAGHRWSQWSRDGGDSWSDPELVAPLDVYDGIGLRNFNDGMPLALDGNNRVHLFSSGSKHLTHLIWTNGIWSGWDDILNYEPLHPKTAVLNGNQLFFIGTFTKAKAQIPQSDMRIWWMSAPTNADSILADLKPSPVPLEATKPSTESTSNQTTPTAAYQLGLSETPSGGETGKDQNLLPLALAAGSVVGLLFIILIVRFRGESR